LLEAYNSNALNAPGSQLTKPLLLTRFVSAMTPDTNISWWLTDRSSS